MPYLVQVTIALSVILRQFVPSENAMTEPPDSSATNINCAAGLGLGNVATV
jgi:hypothetical protein